MEVVPAFFGTAGLGLGIGALRFSWRRKDRMHSGLVAGAWMVILGSLALWGLVGSADWGMAIGIILLTVFALILLGFHAWSAFTNRERPSRPVAMTNEPNVPGNTPFNVYVRRCSTFLLAAPLGGGVATILSLSMFQLLQSLGGDMANATATTFLLAPLLWSAIATWMVIDHAMARKAALLLCCAAFGVIHLGWGTL